MIAPNSKNPTPQAAAVPPIISQLHGGRYQLLDLIGVGGAGTVYRARDIELDEIVALKVLRKELVRTPLVIDRFRSEVKLGRRITHRNIARMFDIDEHEGERFLTMEFVEGNSLSHLVGQPLAMWFVLDVAQQICAGLDAAHAASVIHLDLKPDNVILAKDGRVVLTDFGIARALQPSESATQASGEFIGTPEYMSPEQAEGGPIDFRTDLYSLGVMLFELLTGFLPFSSDTPLATATARLLRPPPDPRSHRPNLPEPLSHIVLRCLARRPDDRYASASQLAESLATASATIPGAAPPHASTSFLSSLGPRGARTNSPVSTPIDTPSDSSGVFTGGLLATIDQVSGTAAKSVAVLPFRNQGPPTDAYLAEGLTDDLVDSLSMVQGLRVRSRGVVSQHLDKTDPVAIGRALEVDILVEGTVRRSEETLRITARLIQGADGVQVWAQRFDRPAALALQVSDEVAQAVALALAVSGSAPQRAVLQDAQAVDLYLRARALFQSNGDRQSMAECVALYQQALTLRPDDPQLLTGYALAQARLWFFGAAGSGEAALATAERAVAVAPERGDSHLALASVRFSSCDLVGAVGELMLALERGPNLADAHDLLGRILVETGPLQSGLRHLEHALELEPNLTRTLVDRARVEALLGHWDSMERLLDRAESSRRTPTPMWVLRARMAMWQGDSERAAALLAHPEVTNGKNELVFRFLQIAARVRKTDPAQLLEGFVFGVQTSSPRGRLFFHQMATEIYSFQGELDSAVRSLARAVDVGLCDLIWYDRCPLLNVLRRDLRFKALRKVIASRSGQVKAALRE
jgi:serine/threonine-protein kinase